MSAIHESPLDAGFLVYDASGVRFAVSGRLAWFHGTPDHRDLTTCCRAIRTVLPGGRQRLTASRCGVVWEGRTSVEKAAGRRGAARFREQVEVWNGRARLLGSPEVPARTITFPVPGRRRAWAREVLARLN